MCRIIFNIENARKACLLLMNHIGIGNYRDIIHRIDMSLCHYISFEINRRLISKIINTDIQFDLINDYIYVELGHRYNYQLDLSTWRLG